MTLNLIKSLGRFQYSALCKSEMLKPHIRLTANTWSYTQPNHNLMSHHDGYLEHHMTQKLSQILEKLESSCFHVESIKYLWLFVISN